MAGTKTAQVSLSGKVLVSRQARSGLAKHARFSKFGMKHDLTRGFRDKADRLASALGRLDESAD